MILALEEEETAKNRRHQNSAEELSPLQAGVISFFVQVSRVLGQSRGHWGEIYGLLFVSPRPLTLDHLIHQLGRSKGQAAWG
jgi:DNA-binding transcriptional regulator GbsR (MarR family)